MLNQWFRIATNLQRLKLSVSHCGEEPNNVILSSWFCNPLRKFTCSCFLTINSSQQKTIKQSTMKSKSRRNVDDSFFSFICATAYYRKSRGGSSPRTSTSWNISGFSI